MTQRIKLIAGALLVLATAFFYGLWSPGPSSGFTEVLLGVLTVIVIVAASLRFRIQLENVPLIIGSLFIVKILIDVILIRGMPDHDVLTNGLMFVIFMTIACKAIQEGQEQ